MKLFRHLESSHRRLTVFKNSPNFIGRDEEPLYHVLGAKGIVNRKQNMEPLLSAVLPT